MRITYEPDAREDANYIIVYAPVDTTLEQVIEEVNVEKPRTHGWQQAHSFLSDHALIKPYTILNPLTGEPSIQFSLESRKEVMTA